MKPYSVDPSLAQECKYARKRKRVHTRQLVERANKKLARSAARKEIGEETVAALGGVT